MAPSRKRSLDSGAAQTPAKRLHADVNDNINEILSHITHADLLSCYRQLLADPQAGPVAKEKLQSYSGPALKAEQARVQKDADRIKTAATTDLSRLNKRAFRLGTKGATELEEWGDSVAPFLPHAYNIWKAGPRMNGPRLAFDVLLHLASEGVGPSDGDERRTIGDGDENDRVYKDIESMLLRIALEDRDASLGGAVTWLKDPTVNRWSVAIKEVNKDQRTSWSDFQYTRIADLLSSGELQGELPPLKVSAAKGPLEDTEDSGKYPWNSSDSESDDGW